MHRPDDQKSDDFQSPVKIRLLWQSPLFPDKIWAIEFECSRKQGSQIATEQANPFDAVAEMIDTIKDFILNYYYQVLSWYDGLTYVQQFFTLFGLFAAVGVAIGLYLIKRAAS